LRERAHLIADETHSSVISHYQAAIEMKTIWPQAHLDTAPVGVASQLPGEVNVLNGNTIHLLERLWDIVSMEEGW
jgi:hypothetical protein